MLDFLKSFFKLLGIDWGSFVVRHGTHEVIVKCNVYPQNVKIYKNFKGGEGCGHIPANHVTWSYVLFPCTHKKICKCPRWGIKFKTKIESEKCKISWIAFES